VCLRTTADPRLPGNADRTFTHCTALLKGPAVTSQPQWLTVDEGWGRKAVDFATLSEPANCREYATLHHLLALNSGDRVLDLACGSGLALELAAVRGASCSGIDASGRLVAIAKDRLPHADIRVGDMNQLPWPDASFDVVTSFRGIWVTTPDAVTEAWRVLRLGGRFGLTVWGHTVRRSGCGHQCGRTGRSWACCRADVRASGAVGCSNGTRSCWQTVPRAGGRVVNR
jgi:SAM-dependent methyltransferase